MPRQQIHVVPNAIDPKRLVVSQPGAVRCAFRNRSGWSPATWSVCSSATTSRSRGSSRSWRPWARAGSEIAAAGRFISWSAAVANPAPYRRLASRLGLSDTVHFLGFYPDVEACYWSSDFFVQPTYYDPCSLVVLEALACGLPVITTAQNGASELMTDGREGYVLTAPDAQGELIAALDHMTDDAARRAMSAEAPRLGRLQTFDVHVARLIAIFEEVAASKSAARAAFSSKRGSRHRTAPHFDRSEKSRRLVRRRRTHRGDTSQEGSIMQGRTAGGRQGNAAAAVHPRAPQAAHAAGRRRPDADHRGRPPPARPVRLSTT